MNPMNALRQYRNVNAHSQMADATPHQLIQMLMAGGLSRIAQAKGTMQRGQLAEKGIMIAKALSILG
ncbi:flagellar protein FliS, partial [Pseudomonas syringae]|uniref:flagellar protein FliS n=2 Tax=Pseudomonas TaxID=286 RepID=UPI0034D97C3A